MFNIDKCYGNGKCWNIVTYLARIHTHAKIVIINWDLEVDQVSLSIPNILNIY